MKKIFYTRNTTEEDKLFVVVMYEKFISRNGVAFVLINPLNEPDGYREDQVTNFHNYDKWNFSNGHSKKVKILFDKNPKSFLYLYSLMNEDFTFLRPLY
jgi:hypothetical protein